MNVDLGDPNQFGHGLVQGVAAYNYLLDQPRPCGEQEGSGGFDPNGNEAETGNPLRPVTDRKTPKPERKTRICNRHRRAHPFCGEGGDEEMQTERRARYLRHGRDSEEIDG